MIHYKLRCRLEHGFEAWFSSSGAFEQQAQQGQLSCPFCGDTEISRGMMAPAVRTSKAQRQTAPAEETGIVAPAAPMLPDAVRAGLQRLRAAIERDCENMGDRFANEAIRMHHGDVEERGIYGSTTERDRAALEDAGVDAVAIPWLRRADG